jgi:hypothetical protein
VAVSFIWKPRKITGLSQFTDKLSHNVVYIYPIELEIKDITDTDRSASYFDLHLEIDSEGRLRTKLYDKKRWFQFSLCELSIDKHLHMEYISLSWYDIPELVVAIRISLIERHSRACSCYQGFLDRELLLTRNLLNTKGSSWLSWSHNFDSFTVATMTWLTVTEYLCRKW